MVEDGLRRRTVFAGVAAAALAAAAVGAVILQNVPQEVAVPVYSYVVGSDGRELTVKVGLHRLEQIVFATALESENSVKVVIIARRQQGTAPSDILLLDVPIRLSSPLGDRVVVDANGNPVRPPS